MPISAHASFGVLVSFFVSVIWDRSFPHTHVFIDRWRSEKAEFSSRRINFLQTDHLPYPPC